LFEILEISLLAALGGNAGQFFRQKNKGTEKSGRGKEDEGKEDLEPRMRRMTRIVATGFEPLIRGCRFLCPIFLSSYFSVELSSARAGSSTRPALLPLGYLDPSFSKIDCKDCPKKDFNINEDRPVAGRECIHQKIQTASSGIFPV
jgi:hypothetical protein